MSAIIPMLTGVSLPAISIIDWYGICFGGLLAIRVCSLLFWRAGRLLAHAASTIVLRRLRYPPAALCGRPSRLAAMSRLHALGLGVIWAANIFCIFFRFQSLGAVSSRSAALGLVNLLPLLCTSHIDYITIILGAPSDVLDRLHRWLGILSTVEVSLHAGIELSRREWNGKANLFGIVVSSRREPQLRLVTPKMY